MREVYWKKNKRFLLSMHLKISLGALCRDIRTKSEQNLYLYIKKKERTKIAETK